MAEIVNKVKDSGLIQLDMAEFKPSVPILGIDLTEQLWQGLVLREKDFRAWISTHDWSAYDHTAVYIFCSSDAIIPTWAYMLIGSDLSKFKDQRVIVKGCSDIPNPDFASMALVAHIRPVVKSLMYGEPCSTVPIYKKR